MACRFLFALGGFKLTSLHFGAGKVSVFYLTRAALGLVSALSEASLYG